MSVIDILFKGQENLLVLLSAFIIGGVFKTRTLFLPLFSLIAQRVHSKRLSLFFVSLIGGVLPVEGRVSVSAPILDSLVKKTVMKRSDYNHEEHLELEQKRGKMGVLDYVANHHYYLWSPLEKSIILLMGGLGLSYSQVLSVTAWPLFLYFVYLLVIVFVYVKEDDITINQSTPTPWGVKAFANILPFVAGIGWSIATNPVYVFPIVALFYVLRHKVKFKELLSFINWKALGTVALIIVIANILKDNQKGIVDTLNRYLAVSGEADIFTTLGFALAVGGLTSFLLGSSSKYAGIAVALTTLFGMKYFPIILMVEYAAYLISPSHKCLAISVCYFHTNPIEFYKRIGILAAIMLCAGIGLTGVNCLSI